MSAQDNWDYWVDHYNNPQLRAAVADQDEPTVSQYFDVDVEITMMTVGALQVIVQRETSENASSDRKPSSLLHRRGTEELFGRRGGECFCPQNHHSV